MEIISCNEVSPRIDSTDFMILANLVPNIGGYKLILGLDVLKELKANLEVARATVKIRKARIQVRPLKH
jgi:hypothetical protein